MSVECEALYKEVISLGWNRILFRKEKLYDVIIRLIISFFSDDIDL
jgi:hypothetical protein